MGSNDILPYMCPIGPICLEDSFFISLPAFCRDGNFIDYRQNLANNLINFKIDKPIITEIPPSFKPKKKIKFYKPSIEDLI